MGPKQLQGFINPTQLIELLILHLGIVIKTTRVIDKTEVSMGFSALLDGSEGRKP